MKILVTGGAGFIGSHIAHELCRQRHAVTIIDDLSGGSLANLPEDADFLEVDITDRERIQAVFSYLKPDVVYHFAAYAAENLSSHIPHFNYTNNILGSINLISSAINHGTRAFIYASSVAVYGHGMPPFSEAETPHPADSYGIAKLAVEQELANAQRRFGLPSIIFRMHNVYGPAQNLYDLYRNVIAIFIRQALEGTPLTIFGDGSQTRAFTFISDILPTLALAHHLPPGTYNIGTDRINTVREVADCVIRAAGNTGHSIKHLASRLEAYQAYTDHTLLRTHTGGWPETPLADGIKQTFDWAIRSAQSHPVRTPLIEIPQNLPEAWR